jgi:flavin-dependent dehydrogenase
VTEVADRGDGWDIDVSPAGGEPYRLQAKVLVDASGQSTFLGSRLRLKRIDPDHRRYAVFGHFHGVERSPGQDAGNILIVPFGEGHWFWFIPLADDITSIGAVVTKETVHEHRHDLTGYLLDVMAKTPAIQARCAGAKLAWEVHTLSDFSYACSQFAGDRFLLVGDAGAFLDPVFSSGVHLAMSSGKRAAASIARALAAGDTRRAAFADYEASQTHTIKTYFRLIRAFYKPSFLHMFMNPTLKLQLQPAVIMLLAGQPRNSLAVRLRLELFYLLGKLLRWLPENRAHSTACSHGCMVHPGTS